MDETDHELLEVLGAGAVSTGERKELGELLLWLLPLKCLTRPSVEASLNAPEVCCGVL